ncbi:MAG: ABC transporter ATP-binding protein [Thermoprotei archaeon]
MARVKLVNVTKRFKNVVAVDRINLDIRDGEFFALLGPSGSGKTTTLRLIAGLEIPDEGEIYIDDELVNYVHPKKRNVAMVFQNYALYPHMTVYDNIAFPLEIRRKELGLSKEDIRKRVVEIARLLGIENLLDRYPSQLSGGQQQRVALARALVRRPKVWLLDEPLSNLDAKLRLQMRVELKKLQKQLGVTTVYVTHDQVEAMSMADRIAVMNEGKVMQIGTPEELYFKPSNTFVATFIGAPAMNLIPCNMIESSENYQLECPGIKRVLDSKIAKYIIEKGYGPSLLLGIRPEFIKVYKAMEKPDLIKAKVVVEEPLGSEVIVTIDLEGELIKAKAPPGTRYGMGKDVYIEVDWDKILLFDKKTGKAIV